MYIYLDESGDLGFGKKGASKYIVITLLATNDVKGVEKCIKKVRHKKLKKRLKILPEMKGAKVEDLIVKKVLECLVKKNIEIYALIVKKSDKSHPYLHKDKEKFYNYMVGMLLTTCSFDDTIIKLIVDKGKSKEVLREEFDKYVLERIDKRYNLKIEHIESHRLKGLQAVDFLSWSIFRKYEFEDERFYQIIKDKIVTEKRL